jgi:hypothetical protein
MKYCRVGEYDEDTKRCIDNPDFFKWPGMKAKTAELCISNKLVDGFCRGKYKGEACDTHFDCDVGLRCGLDRMCDPAAEEGEACDPEYQLCQSYLSCREKQCIAYGSLEDGTPLGRGSVDLCKTRYANNHDVCDEAPTLKGDIFVENTDVLCVYTNGEDRRAVCGYHQDGKAICKPGMATLVKEWTALLTYLKKKPQCHPYLTDMGQCDYAITVGEKDYYQGRVAYYDLHFYTQIQKVPPCVQKFVHADYFDLLKKNNTASTYALPVLGLMAISLALF